MLSLVTERFAEVSRKCVHPEHVTPKVNPTAVPRMHNRSLSSDSFQEVLNQQTLLSQTQISLHSLYDRTKKLHHMFKLKMELDFYLLTAGGRLTHKMCDLS